MPLGYRRVIEVAKCDHHRHLEAVSRQLGSKLPNLQLAWVATYSVNIAKAVRRYQYWAGRWLPMVLAGTGLALLPPRRRRPTEPSRIAVFLVEHIGDAIISIPMLRALRRRYPTSHITVVISRNGFPILEHCPYVDRVITTPAVGGGLGSLVRMVRFGQGLRFLDLDLLLVPKDMVNDRFAELAALATPARWKRSLRSPVKFHQIKPLRFAPLYDECVITNGARHEAEFRLLTVGIEQSERASLEPEAWLTAEDERFATEFVASLRSLAGSGPLVAFGIGASTAKRLWPLEAYAAVIDGLHRKSGAIPIVLVGPAETAYAQRLSTLAQARIHVIPSPSIRRSLAVLRGCDLFVGNDSGPMHMAASVKIPVVEISCHPITGPARSGNSPVRFGPLARERIVLQPVAGERECAEKGCQFEHKPHCVLLVEPAAVLDAAFRLLSKSTVQGDPPLDLREPDRTILGATAVPAQVSRRA